MAQRPVYIPEIDSKLLVKTDMIDFIYHNGFSVSQKQKSIKSLHKEIENKHGFTKVLEVSSKSEHPLGLALSAFNLMIQDKKANLDYSVECAFQSSKVFENGGPYVDLLKVTSREAKKDNRIKNSGNLKKFVLYKHEWDLEPSTAFYDWLYINALKANTQYHKELLDYQAFTDIEFNPTKSINCQAYSIAMFCSLTKRGLLESTRNPREFLKFYDEFKISNTTSINKSVKQQWQMEL